jgi:hypothetical protein
MASGALRVIAALVSGLVFGLGLAVSGMMNPAKVIGFLDVAGDWDPTLAFVMIGALLVAVPAYRFIPKRPRPVWKKASTCRRSRQSTGRWSWAPPLRDRLGPRRVLPRARGRRARHWARPGPRVRRSDAGGDGPSRVAKGLLEAL